jgi:hypothetical protein
MQWCLNRKKVRRRRRRNRGEVLEQLRDYQLSKKGSAPAMWASYRWLESCVFLNVGLHVAYTGSSFRKDWERKQREAFCEAVEQKISLFYFTLNVLKQVSVLPLFGALMRRAVKSRLCSYKCAWRLAAEMNTL